MECTDKKISIITRICYETLIDDYRLELMQKYFIQSLKEQTCKDFNVVVCWDNLYGKKSHPDNLEKLKALNWSGLEVHFVDDLYYQNDITVRCDSDDSLAIIFVEYLSGLRDDNLLVNFKPLKRYVGTNKTVKHERDYNHICASMFLALIQRGEKLKHVYDRPHCEMAKHIGNVLTVTEGLVCLNIHESNMTSK
jgi:hypothetical protein